MREIDELLRVGTRAGVGFGRDLRAVPRLLELDDQLARRGARRRLQTRRGLRELLVELADDGTQHRRRGRVRCERGRRAVDMATEQSESIDEWFFFHREEP